VCGKTSSTSPHANRLANGGDCQLCVQGLLIRFMRMLPAHRTATIKAITRSPVMPGSVAGSRWAFKTLNNWERLHRAGSSLVSLR
jgi:hypothetical protein